MGDGTSIYYNRTINTKYILYKADNLLLFKLYFIFAS